MCRVELGGRDDETPRLEEHRHDRRRVDYAGLTAVDGLFFWALTVSFRLVAVVVEHGMRAEREGSDYWVIGRAVLVCLQGS